MVKTLDRNLLLTKKGKKMYYKPDVYDFYSNYGGTITKSEKEKFGGGNNLKAVLERRDAILGGSMTEYGFYEGYPIDTETIKKMLELQKTKLWQMSPKKIRRLKKENPKKFKELLNKVV